MKPAVLKKKTNCKAEHNQLKKLSFKPTRHIDDEISIMLDDLLEYKDRINEKKEAKVKILKWQGKID